MLHVKRRGIRQPAGDRALLVLFICLTSLFAAVCLLPIVLAFSAAFSSNEELMRNGYLLWPQKFTTETFVYLWQQKGYQMVSAYRNSLLSTALGTALAVGVTVLYAYACAVPGFKRANLLSFFAYLTMLFNGGMLAWYILCTKYYHLTNTLLALILPSAMNVFNMYLMRNYFKSIPVEMHESARIDGAGHLTIFLKIMLPLGKTGLVTIALFYGIAYWNDFYLSLMLIRSEEMFTVQYLLYRMMSQLSFLSTTQTSSYTATLTPPVETARMAMTVIALGPIILIYPFIQRYFVKGVIVGALKG